MIQVVVYGRVHQAIKENFYYPGDGGISKDVANKFLFSCKSLTFLFPDFAKVSALSFF